MQRYVDTYRKYTAKTMTLFTRLHQLLEVTKQVPAMGMARVISELRAITPFNAILDPLNCVAIGKVSYTPKSR